MNRQNNTIEICTEKSETSSRRTPSSTFPAPPSSSNLNDDKEIYQFCSCYMASLETGGQTLKNKIPPYICIYIPTNNLFWGLVLRSCDVIEDGRTDRGGDDDVDVNECCVECASVDDDYYVVLK